MTRRRTTVASKGMKDPRKTFLEIGDNLSLFLCRVGRQTMAMLKIGKFTDNRQDYLKRQDGIGSRIVVLGACP